MTVAIPTLAADSALIDCVRSLHAQTFQDFEAVVIDNSGGGLVRRHGIDGGRVRVIENRHNVGFGAAINQAWRSSQAPFLATLNDDAEAHPNWLNELLRAVEQSRDAGMVASCVLLSEEDGLDSAGMLICGDGSSKQRGHGLDPSVLSPGTDALLPSGSAALYRREMLEATGGFDDEFFLYCEDTDLGLRARWAGWRCVYAANAIVRHRYSHSAGRASSLKAYYVERNRLAVLVKNFPLRLLWRAPFITAVRYSWHLRFLLAGRGAAAKFHAGGGSGLWLPWFVLRAHASLVARLPRLLRERRRIRRNARLTADEFVRLIEAHAISAREVAAL